MGSVVGGALFPHPPLLIPDIGGGDIERIRATQHGVRTACWDINDVRPDCLVVITPHGVVLNDSVTMLMRPQLSGSFANFGHPQVTLRSLCDLELSKQICHQAFVHDQHLTVVTDELARSQPQVGQVDHGALVPLYYLREAGVDLPLVHLSTGMLSYRALFDFGRVIRQAIQVTDKRVAIVTSGDLSHRLAATGPYGYHPDGPVFDQQLLQAMQAMDVQRLLDIDEQQVENAGQCGLRPLYLLLGVLDGLPVDAKLLSYEGPFGVGYAVMTFAVDNTQPGPTVQAKQPLQQGEWTPVRVARQSMKHFLATGHYWQPPLLPTFLQQPSAAFVSLKKFGALRGCIGTFLPTQPSLVQEIIHNAVSAATRDPRFGPVTTEELPDLDVSVDVLSQPQPISSKQELDPKVYGVIVRTGQRTGLLLPDLEGVNTVEEQLTIAMQKAGIAPGETIQVSKFTVTRYKT